VKKDEEEKSVLLAGLLLAKNASALHNMVMFFSHFFLKYFTAPLTAHSPKMQKKELKRAIVKKSNTCMYSQPDTHTPQHSQHTTPTPTPGHQHQHHKQDHKQQTPTPTLGHQHWHQHLT